MRGLIDNSVNLGGAQTITGVKTVKINKIDLDTIPDSTTTATCFNFVDAKNRLIGRIEAQQDNTNTIFNGLVAKNLVSGETKTSAVRAGVKADGDATTVAPSDIENKSLVTTVSHLFNTYSGYVKLGNGLILQWGRATNTVTNSLMSVTFPTPFTEATSYSVTGSSTLANASNQGHDFVSSLTATNFKFQINSDMTPANWIAIGR